MDWRIYYGDGSTFDSSIGEWADAPSWDVQVIQFPDPDTGRGICAHGGTYAIFAPWMNRPHFDDWNGVTDYLRELGSEVWARPRDQVSQSVLIGLGVKFGRWRSAQDFGQILHAAKADTDFPVRSGTHVGEREPRTVRENLG